MNGAKSRLRSHSTNGHSPPQTEYSSPNNTMNKKRSSSLSTTNSLSSTNTVSTFITKAPFLKWRTGDLFALVRYHPVPCFFFISLLFFMAVESTVAMIPPTSAPFDLGFVATESLHRSLAARPNLNTILAGVNTVLVGMQTGYILWTWLIEGRPRATISSLFTFTCRGILGCVTQLPLPEDFLGSDADFPVGNASFFLFFSGHVAVSVIASLDMKRMQRWELAHTLDFLNVLQVIRLLSTRGHYTIDLAIGVGAGILFDSLAGKYEDNKKREGLVCSNDTRNGFE